jgi:hypothetical protein
MVCLALLVAAAGALLAPSDQRAAPGGIARVGAFPGAPYFSIGCGFSHRNNDDPIVFPKEPGRSHNHTYIGNRSVDSSTSAASLLGGATTCDVDADASTYWVPTLYAATDPVHPLVGIAYYIRRSYGNVVPHPAGLKMVAGNPAARRRQPKGIVSWSCGALGGTPRFAVIPSCSENHVLQLQVTFPSCWNGRALDSPDHRRHMAYASGGRCPESHSVALPALVLILLYPPQSPHAQVASGRFAAHADFINGWDQDVLAKLVAGMNH